MRTKVLSVILSLCMIFTIMPITAFAADVTEHDLSKDSIIITENGNYLITQTDSETATSNTITVEAETASITIKDINIEAGTGSAFFIGSNSSVELTISGTNSLKGARYYAGLWVPTGASVTIQSTDGSVADSLTANGGSFAAGIGGSDRDETSSEEATCGTVNIKSGTIDAKGGDLASGIGGGYGGDGGIITISAEEGVTTTVTATGGAYGAGIGGGEYGNGEKITISAETGGSTTVTATGGLGGAGIGGGASGDCEKIEIKGSTVTAKGEYVGIGSRKDTGSIDISDSTIIASGKDSAIYASEVNFDYTDGYKWRTSDTANFTFSDKLVYTSSSNDKYLEIAPGIAITGIELDESPLALNVGETDTLTATITPDNATNKAITWTSSNTDVATIDENGEITAIGAGEAIITATTANGKTATCVVTVTVPVTGIELDMTALALNVGDSDTLTATIAPENATNKTIVWSSSDTSVATVENGTITAVNGGEATITATTANGKTATCVVTVTVPVTGIELDMATLALNVGDSEVLTATITPSTASDKTITWTSSDESVATVDENGQVVAVGVGVAIITATSGEMTATCEITVTEPTPEETNGITGFLRMIKMILELIIYVFGLFAG